MQSRSAPTNTLENVWGEKFVNRCENVPQAYRFMLLFAHYGSIDLVSVQHMQQLNMLVTTAIRQVREVRAQLQHAERQNEELYAELEAAQLLVKEREQECQQLADECKKLSDECSSQVSQIRTANLFVVIAC